MGRTQEISNVKPERARMPDAGRVVLTLGVLPGIYHLALCQQEDVIEQGNNVTAGLVDGEDHCTMVISS